jgi:hypothetical protein
MKRTIFSGLIISLIILSCAQEKRSPIEGAWKLIYFDQTINGKMVYQFPGQGNGSQIKMMSKEYFTFVGHFELDTLVVENYGGGTYKLEGDKYEEDIIYHTDKSSIGHKINIQLEIRNDTLIQRYPLDNNWKLDNNNYSTEKYIRLK